MTLPRYPAYRDSGVEWLGEVPAHWTTVRLGALFREAVEEGCEGLPILSVSIHDGVSDRELAEEEMDRKVSRSDDVTKYRRVEPGDLVYNMMRAWQGGFGTVAVSGMVSPAYVIARPTTGLATSFVEQLLRTSAAVEEMRRLSKGVTDFRLRLYWDEFKTLKIAVPSEQEQAAIAAFLDRETAKIDGLVREQERLIELLAEKRRAVVSHAVTKSLDRHVPMKDSGIDCFGEVPAHWNACALKRFWSVLDCKHVTAEFVDEGIPVASIREVQSRYVDLGTAKMTTEAFYELLIGEGRRPEVGDLLFSRNATVGEVAEVADWHPPFAMGQDVCLLRKSAPEFSSAYLRHVLKAASTIDQLACVMIGSTFKRVNVEEIRALMVPMPPADEQHAISTYLDAITTKFDALTTEAERAVALLKERRAALISAAVTGKIDVRGFVEEAA